MAAALSAALTLVAVQAQPSIEGSGSGGAVVIQTDESGIKPPHAPPPPHKDAVMRDIRRAHDEMAKVHKEKARTYASNAKIMFGSRPLKPLVIRSTPAEPKVSEQLTEDLAVMSHVLDKNLKEVAGNSRWTVMGIDVVTLPGTRPTRNIYIEDYGVIFTLRVNMPLRPESESSEAEETGEEVDTDWEEARNEILEGRRHFQKGPEGRKRAYSSQDVQALRETIIGSLKYASNIRNLKDTDWVTIVVTGGNEGGGVVSDFGYAMAGEMAFGGSDEVEGGSTMVIRARKSDIDEFAKRKGEDLEGFQEKVSVLYY